MRGPVAFDITPPSTGVRFDVADHLVTPTSLPGYINQIILPNGPFNLPQLNTYSDTNGLLRPRHGFSQAGGTMNAFLERVLGMSEVPGSPAGNGGSIQVAGTQGHCWFRRSSGPGAYVYQDWTAVAAAGGNIDNPWRFLPWFQAGSPEFIALQASMDCIPFAHYTGGGGLFTLASLQNFPPTVTALSGGGGGNLPAVGFMVDLCALNSRVVVLSNAAANTGTTFGPTVYWSAVNDATTWNALWFVNLVDPFDPNMAIQRTSQTSATIFRMHSVWAMYGVASGDAGAFGFERLVGTDGLIGPCSPAAVVTAEGQQYYMGFDGHIYNFNGSQLQMISAPVDALINATINWGYMNRNFAVYSPTDRKVLFFYSYGTTTSPNVAVVYDLRTQTFDSLWAFNQSFSSGATLFDFDSVNDRGKITANGPIQPYLGCIETGSLAPGVVRLSQTDVNDAGSAFVSNYASPIYRMDSMTAALVSTVETYFQQATTLENVTVTVQGLQSPYDAAPVTITSMAVNLNDPSTFLQTLPPGAQNPQNKRANFVRILIQTNSTLNQMRYGGGSIQVNPDQRGRFYAGTT